MNKDRISSAACWSDHTKLVPLEIERNGIWFDVGFEDVLELVERDRSRVVTVGGLPVTPSRWWTESGE